MTLYVSDLDGTLLNSSASLKPRSAAMLNDFIDNGVMFSYCTARSASSAPEIMKDVNFNIPVILQNGVFIYDTSKGEYIKKNTFGRKQADIIREAVVKYGETPMIHSFIDGVMKNSFLINSPTLKEYISDRKGDKRFRPLESYDGLFDGELFYAVFINPENKAGLDEYFTAENGFASVYYADTYHKDEYWYEVFSASATKANAVLELKKIVGADELVTFGDNGNDLSMFAVSDRCYAVANAIQNVKEKADAVILSNEQYGVTEFIQSEVFPVFDYKKDYRSEPDEERFAISVEKALSRERTTIGTLNEKTIHNTLKCYYGDETDHEAKIGSFYADAAGENGIFEIQTANFSKLRKKLSVMLRACHTTVVYPLEKKIHNYSVNEKTGEIISSSNRTDNSYSGFFLELYRIKEYLTNPNLTIIIAELEISKKTYYKSEKRIRTRGMKKEKIPERLIKEIRLENKADYGVFIPEELPESFTRKDFAKLCGTTDAGLSLEILEFVGAVKRVGKSGNAIVYSRG